MPLNDATRLAVFTHLFGEVWRFVQESLRVQTEKPFHTRLLPALATVRFSERSFSTRSGSWFQKTAHLIAKQYHRDARLNHLVVGNIQPAAEAHIRAIVEEMDHGKPRRLPNRATDIAEVLTVQSPGGTHREVRSDLFVLRHDGGELYFEMKTPTPNKGQCKTMKQDILLIAALRKGSRADSFAAAAYNPYGDEKPYAANYVGQFLEIDADIIVGRPFWSLIGERSTYDELLQIADAVGREIEQRLETTPLKS